MTDSTNQEVQFIEDMDTATEYQLKHTPNISITESADGKVINVSIGLNGLSHPQTEEHLFEWIALYDGDKCVEQVNFTYEDTPVAAFTVAAIEGLVVRAFCNLHGVFGAFV